jgi:hypothetical protein
MAQTTPFTAAELTDIRRFAGYAAYAAFGYVLSPEMATLDTQCADMSDAEQAVVRTTYLANLYTLETGILTAATNMGTDIAAVWTRNKSEAADRVDLFNSWRLRLCNFIGCVPGKELRGTGRVVRT